MRLAHGKKGAILKAMRWSVRIARVAGTEVRIHITFLLFVAWIGFSYYQLGGAAAAILACSLSWRSLAAFCFTNLATCWRRELLGFPRLISRCSQLVGWPDFSVCRISLGRN